MKKIFFLKKSLKLTLLLSFISAHIDAILNSIAHNTLKRMSPNKDKGKGVKPFMGKLIYLNLLVDMATIFRAYTLYPELTTMASTNTPQLVIANKAIMKSGQKLSTKETKAYNKATNNIRVSFETIRETLVNDTTLPSQLKPFINKKNLKYEGFNPSILPFFLHLHYHFFGEQYLNNIRKKPIFRKGVHIPATTSLPHNLDNLWLGKGNRMDKVTDFNDLAFINNDQHICSPSFMATACFTCVNTVYRTETTETIISTLNKKTHFDHFNKKGLFESKLCVTPSNKTDDTNKDVDVTPSNKTNNTDNDGGQHNDAIDGGALQDAVAEASATTPRSKKKSTKKPATPISASPQIADQILESASPILKVLRSAEQHKIPGIEEGKKALNDLLSMMGMGVDQLAISNNEDSNMIPTAKEPPKKPDPTNDEDLKDELTDLFEQTLPGSTTTKVVSDDELKSELLLQAFGYNIDENISIESSKIIMIKVNQIKKIVEQITFAKKDDQTLGSELKTIFQNARFKGWEVSLDYKKPDNDIIALVVPSIMDQMKKFKKAQNEEEPNKKAESKGGQQNNDSTQSHEPAINEEERDKNNSTEDDLKQSSKIGEDDKQPPGKSPKGSKRKKQEQNSNKGGKSNNKKTKKGQK